MVFFRKKIFRNKVLIRTFSIAVILLERFLFVTVFMALFAELYTISGRYKRRYRPIWMYNLIPDKDMKKEEDNSKKYVIPI